MLLIQGISNFLDRPRASTHFNVLVLKFLVIASFWEKVDKSSLNMHLIILCLLAQSLLCKHIEHTGKRSLGRGQPALRLS